MADLHDVIQLRIQQIIDSVNLNQQQRLRRRRKPEMKRFFHQPIMLPSIISIAAGKTPAAITSLTALQAWDD